MPTREHCRQQQRRGEVHPGSGRRRPSDRDGEHPEPGCQQQVRWPREPSAGQSPAAPKITKRDHHVWVHHADQHGLPVSDVSGPGGPSMSITRPSVRTRFAPQRSRTAGGRRVRNPRVFHASALPGSRTRSRWRGWSAPSTSSSWRATCSGAVPPRELRDVTDPWTVSTARTSGSTGRRSRSTRSRSARRALDTAGLRGTYRGAGRFVRVPERDTAPDQPPGEVGGQCVSCRGQRGHSIRGKPAC